MDFLSGLLAFAVVMILMSTIVTGVMEVLVRLLALRGSTLETMMRRFVKAELEGRLDRIVKDYAGADAVAANAKAETEYNLLVNQLTLNPLNEGGSAGDTTAKPSWLRQVLANRSRVDTLTAWAFLQRLARTEYGQAILALGEARALDALTDLSRTYERYAAAAQEAFRKKVDAWSMGVAVVLGVLMNVNAPVLLNHLVADAETRAALIAMGPNAIELGRAADAALAAELEQPSEGGGKELAQSVRKVEDNIKTMTDRAASLKLPILNNAFPHDGSQFEDWSVWLGQVLLWLPGALLGGVLIGLGGPFWYKVFDGLSRLTALVRDISGKSRETAVNPAGERATIVGDLDKEFGTPRMVDSFRIAAGLPGAIDRDGFPPCG